MNYKLETYCGNSFDDITDKAKKIAKSKKVTVEFDFNGIKCLVDKDTNLNYLWRDYCNAHTMDWKVVGTVCYAEYEPEVVAELKRRRDIADEKMKEEDKIREANEKKEKHKFEKKIAGVIFDVVDAAAWKDWEEKNKDPYGAATFEYAKGWARLMQAEMSKGKALTECAEKTSHELGFMGITGFMYGCAVSILSKCWRHGEELRKWHNKEYGVSEDKKGVVNPAILTISTP